jgi:hypothetical protein
LCHRFTQDAVENIFSQMRRKAGQTPNAIQSFRALKIILMSQYVSDVKRSNYMNDSDEFLLNYFKKVPENFNSTSIDILQPTYNVKPVELLDYVENIPEALKILPEYDMNIVFHLVGSATNTILKVSCNTCYMFMCNITETVNFPEKYKFYTKALNKGGLKEPCANTVLLMFNCELIYRKYKNHFLHNSNSNIIDEISNNMKINYPHCGKNCNVKHKLIKHYFTVRSYATCNLSVCRKKNVYMEQHPKRRSKIKLNLSQFIVFYII